MSVSKEISREFQGYLKEVKEVSGVFRECFKKVQWIFKVFQQRKFTGWLKVDGRRSFNGVSRFFQVYFKVDKVLISLTPQDNVNYRDLMK